MHLFAICVAFAAGCCVAFVVVVDVVVMLSEGQFARNDNNNKQRIERQLFVDGLKNQTTELKASYC